MFHEFRSLVVRSSLLIRSVPALERTAWYFQHHGKQLRFVGIMSSPKPDPITKIFRFTGILIYGKKQPARAAMRDASRSSRNVVRVAMDACGVSAVQTVQAKTSQRTAKSCGPGAATVASIRPALWQVRQR